MTEHLFGKFTRYRFEDLIEARASNDCRFVATTAALIAGGLAAAGAIGGAAIGAHAAGSASDKQATAAQQAADIAKQAGTDANAKIGDVLSQQQQLLQPYVQMGQQGLDALTKATSPGGSLTGQFTWDPASISQDPAYQAQLQQGLDAVKRAAAATGTLNSGGTLKALTNYAQGVTAGYANQDYTQALNTWNTNRQATLQNITLPLQTGQYGTSDLLNALQNYGNLYSSNTINTANTVGNDLTQKGNAQAAATVGAANAWSGALSGISNSAQTFALLSALNNPTSAAVTATNNGTTVPGIPGSTAANPLNVTPQPYQTAPSVFSQVQPYSSAGAYYYGAPPIGQ